MSWWNRYPFSSLTAPRFSGTKSTFVGLYKISHHIAIVFCLMISHPHLPKELVVTFFNNFCAAFSTSLSLSSNFTSYINSLVWGPTNTPSLILASLILGSLFFKYIIPVLFWSIVLTKISMSPNMVGNGGKETFSGWRSGILASWYNYEYYQQDALYKLIYYS